MKTKLLLVSSFLILTIMGLVFSNFKISSTNDNKSAISNKSTEKTQSPPPPANNRWLDRFYIGGIQSMTDCNNNYPNLYWLGFNLWHNYMGSHTGELPNNRNTPYVNWSCNPIENDKLMPDVSSYASLVNANIDRATNNNRDRKLLVSRPKIDWLCYGQRSDYRCVDVSHLDPNLWFYSFQSLNHIGVDVQDNADNVLKWVRYCQKTNPQTDGLVVSRLRANGEQSRRITGTDFGSIQWTGDSQCDWLIKPRIKVPVDFVTPINSETPVCRITVIAQDGNTVLKEVVITGKYFGIGTYDGKYKEDGFYFPPDTNLTIHGDWGDKWAWWVRGNKTPEEENENDCNHSDIQVYWYGNCDMWLDYVRVDNDVADKLFKDYYDDPNYPDNQWIKNEVEQIGMHIPGGASSPAVMKYYLEYAEFNNLPCIRYVNDKLKYYSEHYPGGAFTLDIMQDFTNILSCVVAWENRTNIQNPDFLKTYYIDKAGYSQIFAECYPFIACHNVTPENQKFCKLPSTLPFTENPDMILGKIVPPAEYESYLQDQLFHRPNIFEGAEPSIGCYTEPFDRIYRNEGYFRYIMQTCDKISRDENIPFIFMPQAHQNYQEREVEREPTNEELNMLTNVAVSYGAKGTSYIKPITDILYLQIMINLTNLD